MILNHRAADSLLNSFNSRHSRREIEIGMIITFIAGELLAVGNRTRLVYDKATRVETHSTTSTFPQPLLQLFLNLL